MAATKFLPLSATEVASDVAATDEDPSDTDDDKDSVGYDNDAYEDPCHTDEDLGDTDESPHFKQRLFLLAPHV